jgi:hypothetical protein
MLDMMFSPAPSSRSRDENQQPPQSSPSPTIEESTTSTEEKKGDNPTNARDPNLVDWEPNDKENLRNWSVGFKIWCKIV